MTQAAFARLIGVHKVEVNRAIKGGRLKDCLKPGLNGVMQIADVELAKREWVENGDYTDAPQRRPIPNESPAMPEEHEDDGTPTLQNAAARAKHWEAETKELEYRKKAGELVRASDIEARLADVFTHCKTRLLAIPSRAKQELPQLTLKDLEVLEGLIREALEDLADGAAPASDEETDE